MESCNGIIHVLAFCCLLWWREGEESDSVPERAILPSREFLEKKLAHSEKTH